MKKIGRNDPCFCGSGKKFKKCCYDRVSSIPLDVYLQLERLKAKKLQIDKQQGYGKSIISLEQNGFRFIAVGNRVYHSKRWKTFHDFLFEYIKFFFDKNWGQCEFKKPFEERHPFIQWHEIAHNYLKEHQSRDVTINAAPMTGSVLAYINFSYNLYLLEHNVAIQERLIKRLKDNTQFRGALYETYVAAEFIKAGFDLEIENEEDSRTTHCEFTAVSRKTGRKYSIEAKARQPHKNNVGISKQLGDALTKEAQHERIIFIDVNVPDFLNQIPDILAGIKQKEKSWTSDQKAYLFITNHPFEYDLAGIGERRAGFAHGFKISDFNFNFQFTNIRDVLKARENHRDMLDLIRSFREHEEIPSTFDGEHPEFAFAGKETSPRLIIGEKYIIHDKNGKDVEGVLVNATVLEEECKISGVYRTNTGEQMICVNPMTNEELFAFRRQPDTFFGVPLQQTRKARDPMDLFDFFYDSYKECSRERLLELIKERSDISVLRKLSDEELLITCCEGWVYSAMNCKSNSGTL